MNTDITSIILAGGQAKRMQGDDKGLIDISGRPMIEYVLEYIKPQTSNIIISANRNQEKYKRYGYQVIEDPIPDFQGPLAGILSGMLHANTDYILTLPCDTPSLPVNLIERMQEVMHKENKNLCVAHDGTHIHPVIALISSKLRGSLELYLESGQRKAETWVTQQNAAIADFSDCPDAFVNINTPLDKTMIEKHENSKD